MARIWSSELAAHVGQQAQLAGWLHRFRQLSQVSFLVLRDGKGLSQVVIEDPQQVKELALLPDETVLSVVGTAVAVPAAPSGMEVHAARIEVISLANVGVPVLDLFRPVIKAQLPTILDHAAVALRHPRFRATHRIAAASAEGYRQTLRARGFVEIFTPKLVASATEGGANVFPVDYFGRTAFLAQSPQFYKQIMVGVYERVFEIGPVFRAEPHDTPRHLNEFVSLDFEMGFIHDHTPVMDMLADVLRGMLDAVRGQADDAIGLLGLTLPAVPTAIPAIHSAEAQRLITDSTAEDLTNEPDLAPAHERWLGDWAQRTHNSEFLFVVGYPMAKRPFLHPPAAGSTAVYQQLRSAVPRPGADDRRPAITPVRRLPVCSCGARAADGALRRLPGGVRFWHAAPRWLRTRPGALGSAPGGRGEHPRSHTVSAGHQPADALRHNSVQVTRLGFTRLRAGLGGCRVAARSVFRRQPIGSG